jgi:hypothetical protein
MTLKRVPESIARKMGDPAAISQARKDGRPQYYDIFPGDLCQCYLCLKEGKTDQYSRGFGFMADPGNSPEDDGGVYTICFTHLPENAVIHDPVANMTRTKDGQNNWREQ